MIRYALKCDVDHVFEAWFDSSESYDDQAARGLVECPLCGSARIGKAIMAPMVRTSRQKENAETSAKRSMAEALHRLRRHVENTHDYVGGDFAHEARDIHNGLAPDRPIYGEATPDEVKSLVEDGVPVAPLPILKRDEPAPAAAPAGPELKKLN